MSDRPYRVLLVEDHPADVALTRRAFRKISTPTDLYVVFDGMEAMSFLQNRGRYEAAPRPDLVLLDLNMPRMSGFEVLEAVGQDPNLRTIPFVILTTSGAEGDIRGSYGRCANSYLVKPVAYDQFQDLVQLIEEYWLKTSKIP